MAISVRDLTRDWRPGDAERLARFFNETGRGWPSGPWDPETPEEAERRVKEAQSLGMFISEVGDQVVSFCSLYARPNERHRAYIGLLTAHPDFHGKGYGKAVLHAAIERVYQLGIARVDLHTWPGNLKAVPLYKKSGFMWSPESGPWGVYMQNFTPGARRHPLAQPYFSRHDWYRTLRRDISLSEDIHQRGKVRAYEYLWEEDGDRLRMVYDRLSWGLVEIETNDFLVGCYLSDEKLVAGLPQRIRWRVVNHRREPLQVALIARAEEGILLDHKEVVTVRHRFDAETEFEISPEIREKDREPRAHIVYTDLLINGQPLTLAAGFEVKQAVHFALDGDGAGLRPQRREQLVIQATNELERPARVLVRLSAAGARLASAPAEVTIPARGSAELPIALETDQAGVVALRVHAELALSGRELHPRPAELYAHVLSPGDLLGHVEQDRVVLESAHHHIVIWRREGWVGIHDKVRNRWQVAAIHRPRLGPPFGWDEFFDTRCEARVEREEGRITAVMRSESVLRPGVWLERRITLSNLPTIAVTDAITNASERRLEGRLRFGATLRGQGGHAVAPTRQGIVRNPETTLGRPLAEHDLSDRGEDWPEGWYAVEDREGLVTGLVWKGAARVEVHGDSLELDRQLPAAEPGQSVTLDPVYLFVGSGDFTAVRRSWQLLFGPRVHRRLLPPPTRCALAFGFEPEVPVIHGQTRRGRMVVSSIGRLPLAGSLTLSAPPGLAVEPASLSFRRLCETHPVRRVAAITRRPDLPEGAYRVQVRVQLDRATYCEDVPVLVLGDPGAAVSVQRAGEDGDLFQVDNGRLILTVAPAFCGSAISLRLEGEELLRSAYPQAGPLGYENPWFGGICPELSSLGRDLYKEKFRARPIARRGRQGVLWKGVRVSCTPRQERARWEALSLDYLLAPASQVVAVVVRTTRRTGTAGWMEAGFSLWPVLGGSHLDAVLSSSDDTRAQRPRTDFGFSFSADRWVMAERPETHTAVIVVAPAAESHARGAVLGRDGYCLGAEAGGTHEAWQTREAVFFLTFAAASQARELAEALARLPGLP